MGLPSLRAAAVAAGLVGVSLIVAGTATAMAAGPSPDPVGQAIQLPVPEVSLAPAAGPTAESDEPSAPIEVVAEPIVCSDDGHCGDDPIPTPSDSPDRSEASASSTHSEDPASAPSATDEASAGATSGSTSSATATSKPAPKSTCTLPTAPTLTAKMTAASVDAALAQWQSARDGAIKACGADAVAALPTKAQLRDRWQALVEQAKPESTPDQTYDDGQWRGNEGDWDDGQWHGNEGDWDDGQWHGNEGDWDDGQWRDDTGK
ncbi:hypothetical protein [Demequina globuliformis]|uniref:hypothetical protein n=1 Tax=Demequina globuliformis TaxID=676202 RepID=UPI0007820F64|nr:hypothetical protein [Demequina globuliformis]